jgi:hypothetical protein
MNSRRMNRLEELGRVDAEKAKTRMGKKNLRQEKSRIVRELKADGGKVKKRKKTGPKTGRPAPSQQRRMGRGAQGSRKKEISADNKKRIAVMDAAKETVTGGGMRADRFKEGLNIKGSKDSAMKYYARGDTDHGKLAQKNYEKMKNNTYAKGGKALKPVKPSQRGLSKLPTKVRNKMGYMKKGGRVGMGKAMRGGGCVR